MLVIKKIAVCGAGTMGSGIAQIIAQHGFETVLFDLNEEVLNKSKQLIESSLQTLVLKNKITKEEEQQTLSNIQFASNINNCKAHLIIEAIIENKEAKLNLFKQVEKINSKETIIASNTSSISINQLAAEIQHPQRFAGMHFFNPATIMKLVEIIKTNATNNIVIEQLCLLSKALGKTAVVCNDAPGFIVNRVARHYYLEAMKLIELNLATIENVDAIMQASGFKMGPFKLMDLIGMDINYNVSNIVWNDLGKPERLKPSIIQQQKVEAKQLGKKTGKGFYNY
ncbi:MAG: 3-hydroxybutyryl-CoA dehydrogenase [Bacteroidetes bacterium]|nr:3-hydroxybutyryl-CoA dehydrogenase [Bacteroidota bacterium]MBS1669942.1 3-hydroxybutyryl-CoA dehydrogenase [Bacteroidota bacterium]